MPVNFRILANRGLVYVRYDGFARMDDSFSAFGAYMQDPGFRPGQKQLVDLGGVTGFETDFARLMALQALKASAFLVGTTETLIVYHSPNNATLQMSRLIERSWDGIASVIAMVTQDEGEALAMLGQRETSFSQLFTVV